MTDNTTSFRKAVGAPELLSSLFSLSSLTGPLTSTTSNTVLAATEVPKFLQDLAQRFEPDNEIDNVLGPVVSLLLFHESLARPEGIGGADAQWRNVVGGLEALVSVKAIAAMLPRLPSWNPPDASAANFETRSLMGPLLRLNVFDREWVCAPAYPALFATMTIRSLQLPKHTSQSLRSDRERMLNQLMLVFAAR